MKTKRMNKKHTVGMIVGAVIGIVVLGCGRAGDVKPPVEPKWMVQTNRFEVDTNVFYGTNWVHTNFLYFEMPDEITLHANGTHTTIYNPSNGYIRVWGLKPIVRKFSDHDYQITFERVEGKAK